MAADASTAARAQRVMARCDALAGYTAERGRITRPYGSPAAVDARRALADWMNEAGLATRLDAVGDLRGRLAGNVPTAAALLLGSHFDSVRDAGRYDGLLGVLIAIEAVETLRATRGRAPFPIEVIAFADEEGLRFAMPCLGSCAMAGAFDRSFFDLTDDDGTTLREAMIGFGGDPDAVVEMALKPGDAFAYVEVHIEQGPYLESVSVPVGVVTAISGQTRILASFAGEAGHAGTVAMPLRRDPLPAAAEVILAAERQARATSGLVATVGAIEAEPGASNVIPGRVRFSLDVRHPEDAVRAASVAALRQHASEIAAARRLTLEWTVARDHAAVPSAAHLVSRLERAIEHVGYRVERLPSGAGHDAAALAAVVPMAMLFVRCAGGISHRPDESVALEDVAAAIAVLDRLLGSLADEGGP